MNPKHKRLVELLSEIFNEVRENMERGNGKFITKEFNDIEIHDLIIYLNDHADAIESFADKLQKEIDRHYENPKNGD